MPRFLIREIQSVIVSRYVEADDEDAAYELFCEGEGVPGPHDGNVTTSALLSIELV